MNYVFQIRVSILAGKARDRTDLTGVAEDIDTDFGAILVTSNWW